MYTLTRIDVYEYTHLCMVFIHVNTYIEHFVENTYFDIDRES